MEASQLDTRDYTFCQVFYADPWACRTFLVGATGKQERTSAAQAFAEARWGTPVKVHTYPRNYIKDARALFAKGLHD
jgi:hypothetical protein